MNTTSVNMRTWSASPARAHTVRLDDPRARRAAAQGTASQMRAQAQELVDRAAALGHGLQDVFAIPAFARLVRTGARAVREVKVAEKLLEV